RLVAKRFNHSKQLRLRPFARHPREKTYDSGHHPNLKQETLSATLLLVSLSSVTIRAQPSTSEALQVILHTEWNDPPPSAVQPESKDQPAPLGQRYKVPRDRRFREATLSLELRQRLTAPLNIHQVREVPPCTYLHGLGHQRIIGRLVPVLDLGKD